MESKGILIPILAIKWNQSTNLRQLLEMVTMKRKDMVMIGNGPIVFLIGILGFLLTHYLINVNFQLATGVFHISYCLCAVGFGKMECKTKRDYNILIALAFAIMLLMNLGQIMFAIKEQYFPSYSNAITFDDPWILGK